MSFHVLQFGGRSAAQTEPSAGHASGELVDLASRRSDAASPPELPAQVLADVDAAAERWRALQAENREIRFDADADGGRVTASVRALDGGVVRLLPLRDVAGLGDDGPHSAA